MSPIAHPTRQLHQCSALVLGTTLVLLAACHRVTTAPRPNVSPDTVARVGGSERRGRPREAGPSASFGGSPERSYQRVEQMLEGRFAGVSVMRTSSGGYAVRIRGSGASMAAGDPLYVIDGVPVEVIAGRGLDFLSPADVARIAVLKEPAETSMYGLRGGNGVVLITTKRAR